MGPEAERPGGGFFEKTRSNVDVEDQGNVSDDSSLHKENDEAVDATKFSSVRKTLSTQLWTPNLTRPSCENFTLSSQVSHVLSMETWDHQCPRALLMPSAPTLR